MDEIKKHLEEAVKEYCFSGYQLYGEMQNVSISLYGGKLNFWPNSPNVNEDTLFDVGSLTKVIYTTTLFALLIQNRKISLNDPITKYLPEFKNTLIENLSLENLLSHKSGLISWYPIYKYINKRPLIKWLKRNLPILLTKDWKRCLYSDINFLFLGEIIRKIFGDLERPFYNEVSIPFEIPQCKFGPINSNVASTEYSIERKKLISGEVFDENSYALGGVSAHAGLFSSAIGLRNWCKEWLNSVSGRTSLIDSEISKKFVTPTQNTTWALGWDTKSTQNSSCGSFFSKKSFGHLGYPGCSLWIDPKNESFLLFFTNRIHPSRLDYRIKSLRPLVHDLWYKYVKKEKYVL